MHPIAGSRGEASGSRWSRRLSGVLAILISLSLLSVLVPVRSRDVASRLSRSALTGASSSSRSLLYEGCEVPLPVPQAASHTDAELASTGPLPDSGAGGLSAQQDSPCSFGETAPVRVAARVLFGAATVSLPRGRAPPQSV